MRINDSVWVSNMFRTCSDDGTSIELKSQWRNKNGTLISRIYNKLKGSLTTTTTARLVCFAFNGAPAGVPNDVYFEDLTNYEASFIYNGRPLLESPENLRWFGLQVNTVPSRVKFAVTDLRTRDVERFETYKAVSQFLGINSRILAELMYGPDKLNVLPARGNFEWRGYRCDWNDPTVLELEMRNNPLAAVRWAIREAEINLEVLKTQERKLLLDGLEQ